MDKMFKIPNKQLCEWIFNKSTQSISKEEHVIGQIAKNFKLDNTQLKKISTKLKKSFIPHFNKRMKACKYSKLIFERDGQKFLKNFFIVKFSE